MRTRLALLIGSLALLACSCSPRGEGEHSHSVKTTDVAMNAEIQRAKTSVHEFVKAFHERQPGMSSFFVKKPYPTPSGTAEHMWIEAQSEKDGTLVGIISNDPEETTEVKAGQTVAIKLTEISDWKYNNNGKLVGGFTIRYFIKRMPKVERDAFLKSAGFEL